ncbi:hypothetical protein TWF481_004485 [Arthrobotrys musiformis]|uniref:Uncharacterized protein n=1 Tax=Arthrobotrys musiformis TaxID=47236 RepID=A0AAV9WLL0_9PEZI
MKTISTTLTSPPLSSRPRSTSNTAPSPPSTTSQPSSRTSSPSSSSRLRRSSSATSLSVNAPSPVPSVKPVDHHHPVSQPTAKMGVAQDEYSHKPEAKSRAKSRTRLARSKSRSALARHNTGNSEPKETKLSRHQTGNSEPKESRIRKHDTGNSDSKLQLQKQNTGGSDSQTAIIARAATYTKPLISSATYHLPPPPSGTFGGNTTSLAELAHLVRLQSYQQLKHTQSRIRLHRQLISTGISARLERCGALARTHMVDYFKDDKKREFAVLYNAVHDLKDSCERLAMLQPELDVPKISYGDSESERPKSLHTFLQDIPQQTRDTILLFISTLRSNPKFLADRLCKLSPSDLDTIAKSNQITQTQESVLPTNRKNVTPNPIAPIPTLAVDKLLAFHRLDPLHTLIHTIFANSSGPDSEEDRRRTDVWSTVCARLLNEKRGEKFLYAVMDSWSSMREWPARNNIEVCLMKMLQDGAAVLQLDRQEDTSNDKVRQDLIRKQEEEFYVNAARSLFQTLDDEPCAGGIPEGILELGHAILEKVEDPKRKKLAEVFIVAKWFFGRYLNTAIQYPEYHGMMVGHYISEYARQAILRRVIQRMCTDVFSICFVELKSSRPIDPIVRNHVENIMARFRNPRPKDSNPILLPVKAVTSPRETIEVQPYLVLCPTDVATVFHALFPQASQRPGTSSSEKDFGSKKFSRSINTGRTAISRPPSIFENTSASFKSSSSITSDSGFSTMNAPLLENQYGSMDEKYTSSIVGSPNSFTIAPNIKSSQASIYSIQSATSEPDDEVETFMMDVKMAITEMTRKLGPEATSGRTHPCAEKWAVLFVSADGKALSPRMKTDWEDEDEDDSDSSSDNDSDDDSPGEVSRDYNQVKQAIMKLIEEYEVPEDLIEEDENQSKKFSNRTSVATNRKHAAPVASTVTSYIQDQNPYYQATGGLSALFNGSPDRERQRLDLPRNSNERLRQSSKEGNADVLLTMLSAAQSQCMARGAYVDGQIFHRAVTILLRKLEPSLTRNGFAPLLHILSRGFRVSIEKSAACIEHLEAWFVWLTMAQERHDSATNEMLSLTKALRVKMWYVTDVRNSAAYDDARNVAMALKKMAIPPKTKDGRPISQQRAKTGLTHRMSTSSFSLLKGDSLIDTLAASADNGGPNKLSDEQAEITSAWLKRYSITNFCTGEERIHRFCCEIDKCVNKLVGKEILTGPVLWSSELFARDERELANVRKKGEFHLAGVGGLNMAMDGVDADGEKANKLRPKASASDLFGLGIGRPRSQSIVSTLSALSTTPGSRPRTTRESSMDKNDLFNTPTPQLSMESTPTSAFWSPFGGVTPLAGSPRGKANTALPTLSTSRSMEGENQEKKAFLSTLKTALIGLLLSDLGLDVWSQGSETDSWFSGGLADECMQRREDQERALQERNASSKSLNTVASKKLLNRKKSNKSLKRPVSHANGILEALGRGEKGELAAPVATYETVGHEPHSGEDNSSSSDATARSATTATGATSSNKKGSYQSFPYAVAFRRLLTKFSTHPNPFDKLNALYELEILIVASLTTTTGKTFTRRGTFPNTPSSDFEPVARELSARMSNLMTQPANLDESLAHADERRHAGLSGSPFMTPTGSRTPVGNNLPSTEIIIEVWQELFRQADIRPRTLFRDLQFVASFIPAYQLDLTVQGKAFWDMANAALRLKVDVVKTMVEVADEVVGYHTKRRTPESAADQPALSKEKFDKNPDLKANSPQPQGTEWIARYSMKDAASMWLITAKEGDATAQRELAIFYLTNPALLPLATMPMSKTKDIFRNDSMVTRGVDPEKCDPLRLCVSHHWMELSSREDELAKRYLRQRDEW